MRIALDLIIFLPADNVAKADQELDQECDWAVSECGATLYDLAGKLVEGRLAYHRPFFRPRRILQQRFARCDHFHFRGSAVASTLASDFDAEVRLLGFLP